MFMFTMEYPARSQIRHHRFFYFVQSISGVFSKLLVAEVGSSHPVIVLWWTLSGFTTAPHGVLFWTLSVKHRNELHWVMGYPVNPKCINGSFQYLQLPSAFIKGIVTHLSPVADDAVCKIHDAFG